MIFSFAASATPFYRQMKTLVSDLDIQIKKCEVKTKIKFFVVKFKARQYKKGKKFPFDSSIMAQTYFSTFYFENTQFEAKDILVPKNTLFGFYTCKKR